MSTAAKTNDRKDLSAETAEKRRIRLPSLIWLVLMVLYVLSIVSYDPADLALLEGGMEEVGLEHNLIGAIGAHIARAVFYLFGLAVYPIGLLMLVSVVRGLIPFPLKRQGYIGAMISAALALSILLAMWPERFLAEAESHAIGRAIHPEMCFTGGVLGAALAAPAVNEYQVHLDAGIMRRHIGETGSLVVALALLLPALFLMFMQDWFPVIQKYRNARAGGAAPPAPAPAPVPAAAAPAPVAAAPAPTPTVSVEKKKFALGRKIFDFFMPSAAPEGETQDGTSAPENAPAPDPASAAVAAPPVLPADPSAPAVLPPRVREEEGAAAAPPVTAYDGSSAAVPPQVRTEETEEPVAPPSAVPENANRPAPVVREFAREKDRYDSQQPRAEEKGSPRPGPSSAGAGIQCAQYALPPVTLLTKQTEVRKEDQSHIEASRDKIQNTLESFNVDGHVSEIIVGPRVTRFEVTLAPGVKVEKVTGIQGNISMDLAAETIRILAPIPGKTAVGIEVPNKESSVVCLRDLMESAVWKGSRAQIPIILGRDIAGEVIVTDLAKAPHLLIAGSTGSGKSVCMNTLIMSLLFRFSPEDLRLIMVDPKVVELEMYRPIPHLITPVVNDPKKVPLALRWGVNEMERRYRVMAKVHAKKLSDFNTRPPDPAPVLDEEGEVVPPKLPLLIIIIDELADIMMTEAKGDVETSICRIAQKGRAAGIHLVIATQTPRKDIITGLIKANLPTKIAFKVSSNMDSRVILDFSGAEKLLGSGDMLFKPNGAAGMERIQGSLVTDPEIQKVVDFVSCQVEQHFVSQVVAENVEVKGSVGDDGDDGSYAATRSAREERFGSRDDDEYDLSNDPEYESPAAKYLQPGDSDLIRKALEIIITEQKASTSYLQRRLGIGYNKSAELMDELEKRGIISAPLPGGQKREILITDGLEEKE